MLTKRKVLWSLLIVICMGSFISTYLYSRESFVSSDIAYQPVEIFGLTRYNEDRIVYQHIQKPGSTVYTADNAIASLLIIKNEQVYLFRDGYDDAGRIGMEGYVQEIRRELPKDLWINKINSKPDYVKIADRKIEKMMNVKEDFVEKNFGDFYRNIRNAVINKHVQVFRMLMRDRLESGLTIKRNPISPPAFQEVKEAAKYSAVIVAKAIDETVYYAEDMDGDEVTETFYVTLADGFNWGYQSGPNIIFIYNNQDEDVKQLIGRLCYDAYFGTQDEEKNILRTFPKDTEIMSSFNLEKVTQEAMKSEKSEKPSEAPAGTTK